MFRQLDFGGLLICYTWVSIELITVEINKLFGLYFACLTPILTYFTQVPAHLPIGFGFYAKNAPIKKHKPFSTHSGTIPPFSLWSSMEQMSDLFVEHRYFNYQDEIHFFQNNNGTSRFRKLSWLQLQSCIILLA